jgi:hypothetical protein
MDFFVVEPVKSLTGQQTILVSSTDKILYQRQRLPMVVVILM